MGRIGTIGRVATGVVLASSLSGCWWGQTGFSAARTYDNPHETRLTAATIGRLRLQWSTNRAIDRAGTLYAWNGRVLLIDGPRAVALDAADGELAWESTLPTLHSTENVRGDPAVSGDVVLRPYYGVTQSCSGPIGCRYTSTGVVYAHSTGTGAEVPAEGIREWPADSLRGPDGVSAVGPRYALVEVRNPRRLFAYDLETGEGVYGPPPPGEGSTLPPPSLSLSYDAATGLAVRVRPHETDPQSAWLEAFSLASVGEVPQLTPLWTVATPLVPGDPPVATLVGDRVYVSAGNHMWARDAATGDVAWDVGTVGYIEQLAVRGDTALVASGGTLAAYSDCGTTGCPPTWSTPGVGPIRNVAIAGDLVYVQSEGPLFTTRMDIYRVAGCGAATCAALRTFTIPAAPVDMVVSGGRLIVVAVPFDPAGDRIFAYGV